jgi:hypothetical protein
VHSQFSPSWAENTIMTESTQESDYRHSICTLSSVVKIHLIFRDAHYILWNFVLERWAAETCSVRGGGRGSVFSSQQLTHSLPPFTLQPKQPKFYTGQMHDTLVHPIPSRQIIHIEGNPGPFQVASITDSSSMMIFDASYRPITLTLPRG